MVDEDTKPISLARLRTRYIASEGYGRNGVNAGRNLHNPYSMRAHFTTDEIDRYRARGFLHVPGFLGGCRIRRDSGISDGVLGRWGLGPDAEPARRLAALDADELERWRRAVDAATAERRGQQLDGQPAGHRDDHYANVFLQMMLLSRSSDAVREIIHDPRLGELAADLAGIDGIRIWHDQALIKEPLANATAFHRDVPFWSFDSQNAISVWVALDEATLENGCLYFLPGSQRLTDYAQAPIGANIGDLVARYPKLVGIEPVPVPAAAGDAIYIDGMIAHGAGPNMTLGYRRAMTCAYMPDGARFNGKRNVLSEAYFNSLNLGDVLDNEDEVPLLFRR